MKKLLTMALGLMFVLGAATAYAQEEKGGDTKKSAKKQPKKSPKDQKAPATEKSKK